MAACRPWHPSFLCFATILVFLDAAENCCDPAGIVAGKWFHAAVTYDGAYIRYFVNGAAAGSDTKSGVINTNSEVEVNIANNPPSVYDTFDGRLDEWRLSNWARRPGWIKLCFENQKPEQTVTRVGTAVVQGSR